MSHGLGRVRSTAGKLADEQLRRAAARATQSIAERFGDQLGIWVGCGYPKSGTVWLCNILSSYLNLPHPRDYRLPVAMPGVIHAHWLPSARLPRTVYIVRDGRDVMVSWYFREVRLSTGERNPSSARRRREHFAHVLGPNADLDDVARNLPKFIQAELERPLWMKASWPAHVESWLGLPENRVGVVRYEDMLASVESTLSPVLQRLTGQPVNLEYLRLAADRFDFARQSQLPMSRAGEAPFLRRGVAGDWKTHFSPEAEKIFDQAAGDLLGRLGYERRQP